MTSDDTRGQERSAARDFFLKPVYLTLGIGDALVEKAQSTAEDLRARRQDLGEQVRSTVENAASAVLPTTDSGEGLLGNLGSMVKRATGRQEESSLERKITGEDDGVPFGRGGAKARHARRTAARRRFEAELERESDTYVDRPRRSAVTRTASPAPTGHRQVAHEEPETMSVRLTPADLSNPSGVEAASTAGRAARRAAAREEAEMLIALDGGLVAGEGDPA